MVSAFCWQWEADFMMWFQHLGESGALQSVLIVLNNIFSMFGEETICILIMGYLYWGVNKDKGLRVGFSIIMATAFNCMLKNVFKRLRPYQVVDGVELLRDVDGYSFPSGHSANSASIYPGLAYEFRKERSARLLTVIAIAVPILVALSRVYLGAHWPTDVIVGLAQGFAVFAIVEILFHVIKNEKLIFVILLAFTSLGLLYCKTDDFFTSYGMLIGAISGRVYEQKYVKFSNSTKWYICVARTIVGGLLYLILNSALKYIFGLFATSEIMALLFRVIRYALDVFVLLGIYPAIFKLEDKFIK